LKAGCLQVRICLSKNRLFRNELKRLLIARLDQESHNVCQIGFKAMGLQIGRHGKGTVAILVV